jgi:hypothetical protein
MRTLARAALYLLLVIPFAPVIASGCGGSGNSGDTSNGNTQSSGTAAGGAGSGSGAGGSGATSSTGAAGSGPVEEATCQGHIYACGDTVDNDGDGKIDFHDPDCLGPCDNTEDSYYGGIPGQSGPACIVDCYFDNDSGAGNDECYWNHQCDEHEMAPEYYPESNNGSACEYNPNANTPGTGASCDELYMTQTQTCYDICGPLTPNGCDCFGCCELPGNPGNYVWLGSEDASGAGKCTLANLTDPSYCEPCKPVKACLNPCDPCELCVGKDTLPPECFPDGGTPDGGTTEQCPPGIQPCGLAGQPNCPSGWSCITGCCQENPK